MLTWSPVSEKMGSLSEIVSDIASMAKTISSLLMEKANEFIANQKKKTADALDEDARMLNAYHFLTDWLVQITEDVAGRV